MELVSIMRVLIRKRVMVGIAALASLAVGFAATTGALSIGPLSGPKPATAHATSRVLVDMPASLLVNEPGIRADTTATRAILLADLALSDDVKAAIAKDAGIAPDELHVITPSVSAAPLPNALTERTLEVAKASTAPNVLRLTADGQLPVVWIDAAAPDEAAAKRLADAATAGLQTVAGSGDDRVEVEQLAPPLTQIIPGASGRPLALLAALGTFCLLCGAIVLLTGLSARRSAVSV